MEPSLKEHADISEPLGLRDDEEPKAALDLIEL